jgi:hypothetical protein
MAKALTVLSAIFLAIGGKAQDSLRILLLCILITLCRLPFWLRQWNHFFHHRPALLHRLLRCSHRFASRWNRIFIHWWRDSRRSQRFFSRRLPWPQEDGLRRLSHICPRMRTSSWRSDYPDADRWPLHRRRCSRNPVRYRPNVLL